MVSERLFQNAFRVLPDVLTEAPSTVSMGALLLMVRSSINEVLSRLTLLSGHIPRINIQKLHSSECLGIGNTNDTTGRLPHDLF